MNDPCKTDCEQYPQLRRLNYCHGQMLTAQDFVDEQAYFLEKIALLTRCLDGHGVVCGLLVSSDPLPEEHADDNYQAPESYELKVSCGVAIDAHGRELVLRDHFVCNNLYELFHEPDHQQKFNEQPGKIFRVFLYIEYNKSATGEHKLPTRGDCNSEETIANRWCEKPRIGLTFEPPSPQTCDPCHQPLECNRVYLAELKFKASARPILKSIDNTIRRPIGRYQPTRISGVNWMHTGIYEEDMAECLLKHGLVIHFSAPISGQSIRNHEVELTEHVNRDDKAVRKYKTNDIVEVALSDELDIHNHNPLQILQASIELLPTTTQNQKGEDVTKYYGMRVKVDTRRLAPPLRVLITVRSELILDECCEPIDGANRGGHIRYIGWEHGEVYHPEEKLARTVREYEERFQLPERCNSWYQTRRRYSGTDVSGSRFESWFYVVGNDCLDHYGQAAD